MSVLVSAESLTNVLGVVYVHKKTCDGGDLYLTRHGLQHADLLEIENWYEPAWFDVHRERLVGTSAVYRVPTKAIDGRSLELVVKNCRVGEDVPVETRTLIDFMNAEFNSPWEEFALVMELREGRYGPPDVSVGTQEPLAIYVPPEKMQIWQSGRSQEKINRIKARHPGIELDILRQYKLVYRWIRGKDAVDALRRLGVEGEEIIQRLRAMTEKAIRDLEAKGFAVADMKPDHIILREEDLEDVEDAAPGGAGTRVERVDRIQRLVDEGRYSVIDYELLVRTPSHEEEVSTWRRHSYLDDQRDRFVPTEVPPHLKAVEILGVPYIAGAAESTGGKLWVVGKNARLFDYFLPERWRRTPSWRLSQRSEIHYTFTKDHVHVVWKASRVGERPPGDPSDPRAAKAIEYGFNSPFEEFAIAHELTRLGIPTVYMRAIYRTGTPKVGLSEDPRRFERHRGILDGDGDPVLRPDRDYITVRGYFNGPDWWVAEQRGALSRPLDLTRALAFGAIRESMYRTLIAVTVDRLRNVGYDGTLLEPNDLLLALDPRGELLKDPEGLPEVRITNFELIHKL